MQNRFLFAHYLRGIAALFVLFSHFSASYFISNEFISSILSLPRANLLSFPKVILDFMPVEFPGFLAVLGVSIFFLISGFLIPISVEKYKPLVFIKKRFFRLYPTYFVVCVINIIVAALGFAIFYFPGREYPYSISTILSIFSMGTALFIKGSVPIDPVAWTLAIEVMFYMITLIFFNMTFILKGKNEISLRNVLCLSILLSFFVIFISRHIQSANVSLGNLDGGFFIKSVYMTSFMLIGTSFALHARRRISGRSLFYSVLCQYALFVYTTMKLVPSAFYISTVSTFSWFGFAILVFALGYVINDNLPQTKSLQFLGDVSYPLYLCHSYIGYFVIGVLIFWGGIPRSLIIFLPIPIVLAIAYLIHIKVERRFISL
ncbi:acyltransferase family protein [Escherichia coli]|uniref:acyltransferase family protein n=1 Tax=Escherichia coli TaxID=562 RepID=UPI0019C58781|nr:acyltransferase [Escherichia coli]EKX8147974.1 acyltransferase [Escherichia coli]MCJ8490811.1 acyltransferase [Escherichia coli]MDY8044249.1 acyltransferase [Escherichia coli]MDY8264388.1 acyltransferase [Escherichia coli]MDY8350746.1 acyltransferase [Escherichia coli]